MAQTRKNTSAKSRRKTATPAPKKKSSRAATSASAVRTTMEAKPTPVEISQAAIAEAAYYLWLERGGDHLSNWLEAERRLKGRSEAA